MSGAQTGTQLSQQVVVAFVAGDRDAFQRLFEALADRLHAVVARHFRSPFDQEEALQEVLLQLYRARASFDVNRHEAIGAWACQVARNRCVDLIKTRRIVGREVPMDPSTQRQQTEGTQMKVVADNRLRQALDRFVARLGADEQSFFRLCFVEELSHDEIAVRLGISQRRSKYMKKKMLARLARHAPLEAMA